MDSTEKKVVILFCDMVGYSQKTADMRPGEIRDFIVAYHHDLRGIINRKAVVPQGITPMAGDGAIAIFENRENETKTDTCNRAVQAAMHLAFAMEKEEIPQTRIGIFAGDIIEAKIDENSMQFGASFSVASRLEELCGYFGTSFLMDREVAFWQSIEKSYTVSIGKITPKNFHHPIHAYTIYRGGIHNCPIDVDKKKLIQFIEQKNEAVELFCGNGLQGIQPDFPAARDKLNKLQTFFVEMTGKKDLPSERLLEYIRNNPLPNDAFRSEGMALHAITEDSQGVRLLHLPNELLRAMDEDFYHALVVNTEWERLFKLVWKKKGEIILEVNDPPDGVYYIDTGSVNAVDQDGEFITTLTAGSVFGEMAYFASNRARNATIIANSDVVLRKISGEEFEKLPVIMEIFHRIAIKRRKCQKTIEQ